MAFIMKFRIFSVRTIEVLKRKSINPNTPNCGKNSRFSTNGQRNVKGFGPVDLKFDLKQPNFPLKSEILCWIIENINGPMF